MKRLAYTAVVAFWSFVAALVIVDGLSPGPVDTGDAVAPVRGDLAAHATVSDCWIAVRGEVYDITAYVPLHPSRPQVITAWCGKDATEAFETKGYGRPHSSAAWALLERYRLDQVNASSSLDSERR